MALTTLPLVTRMFLLGSLIGAIAALRTRLEFKNLFLCYYVLAVVMHCILHGDLRIGADPGASLEMERGLGREEELNDRLGGDLPHPFSLWSNLAHGKRKESLRVQPEVSDERAQPLGSMCV